MPAYFERVVGRTAARLIGYGAISAGSSCSTGGHPGIAMVRPVPATSQPCSPYRSVSV